MAMARALAKRAEEVFIDYPSPLPKKSPREKTPSPASPHFAPSTPPMMTQRITRRRTRRSSADRPTFDVASTLDMGGFPRVNPPPSSSALTSAASGRTDSTPPRYSAVGVRTTEEKRTPIS